MPSGASPRRASRLREHARIPRSPSPHSMSRTRRWGRQCGTSRRPSTGRSRRRASGGAASSAPNSLRPRRASPSTPPHGRCAPTCARGCSTSSPPARVSQLLAREHDAQHEVVTLLEQRVQAGAASVAMIASARLAELQTAADLTEAERQQREAQVRLATAVGVPVRAFDGLDVEFPLDRTAPDLERLAPGASTPGPPGAFRHPRRSRRLRRQSVRASARDRSAVPRRQDRARLRVRPGPEQVGGDRRLARAPSAQPQRRPDRRGGDPPHRSGGALRGAAGDGDRRAGPRARQSRLEPRGARAQRGGARRRTRARRLGDAGVRSRGDGPPRAAHGRGRATSAPSGSTSTHRCACSKRSATSKQPCSRRSRWDRTLEQGPGSPPGRGTPCRSRSSVSDCGAVAGALVVWLVLGRPGAGPSGEAPRDESGEALGGGRGAAGSRGRDDPARRRDPRAHRSPGDPPRRGRAAGRRPWLRAPARAERAGRAGRRARRGACGLRRGRPRVSACPDAAARKFQRLPARPRSRTRRVRAGPRGLPGGGGPARLGVGSGGGGAPRPVGARPVARRAGRGRGAHRPAARRRALGPPRSLVAWRRWWTRAPAPSRRRCWASPRTPTRPPRGAASSS